jgi:hypothetical protein
VITGGGSFVVGMPATVRRTLPMRRADRIEGGGAFLRAAA